MTTKILLDTCELTGTECKFCSTEVQFRPYTSVVKENGVFKPTGHGNKRCIVGQICNTAPIGTNPWISEMNTCPVLWSKARYGAIPVGEKVVEKKKPVKKVAKKVKVVKKPVVKEKKKVISKPTRKSIKK